jgi:hypothetical protein
LPSEDLQQHEVIYLIVPAGFTAGGNAATLFFCEQTNAGEGISRDPQGSATGTAPQATGKPTAKQNSVVAAAARPCERGG